MKAKVKARKMWAGPDWDNVSEPWLSNYKAMKNDAALYVLPATAESYDQIVEAMHEAFTLHAQTPLKTRIEKQLAAIGMHRPK